MPDYRRPFGQGLIHQGEAVGREDAAERRSQEHPVLWGTQWHCPGFIQQPGAGLPVAHRHRGPGEQATGGDTLGHEPDGLLKVANSFVGPAVVDGDEPPDQTGLPSRCPQNLRLRHRLLGRHQVGTQGGRHRPFDRGPTLIRGGFLRSRLLRNQPHLLRIVRPPSEEPGRALSPLAPPALPSLSAGFRFTHFFARVSGPARRAAIAKRFTYRRRSSARSFAVVVPPVRVLLQTLQADRLQVARAPSARSPAAALAPSGSPSPAVCPGRSAENGGQRVSNSYRVAPSE